MTSEDGGTRLGAEYVLPLKWPKGRDLAPLTSYLEGLARVIDVTVVDGSPPAVFARHADAWAHLVRHVPPQEWPGRNGKVRGVVTGVRLARHPLVVVADDDVRYTGEALEAVLDALQDVDLVVPQNVFSSWPWHARWDTGRQLVNRAFGGDYPGTLAFQRSFVLDGYDGDVLFENLELIRTVARRGGVVRWRRDLFVDRVPPEASHFWSQRVRQAYDSLAQPGRLAAEAAVLPFALVAGGSRPVVLLGIGAAVIVVAEFGRRRDGGRDRFPASAALWAPVWLAERTLCSWAALASRLRGGVRYSEGRILRAAGPARLQ